MGFKRDTVLTVWSVLKPPVGIFGGVTPSSTVAVTVAADGLPSLLNQCIMASGILPVQFLHTVQRVCVVVQVASLGSGSA